MYVCAGTVLLCMCIYCSCVVMYVCAGAVL